MMRGDKTGVRHKRVRWYKEVMRKGCRWEPNAKMERSDGRLMVHEQSLSLKDREERVTRKKKGN